MHSSVTDASTVLVVWSRSSFTQAHPAERDGVHDVSVCSSRQRCHGRKTLRLLLVFAA